MKVQINFETQVKKLRNFIWMVWNETSLQLHRFRAFEWVPDGSNPDNSNQEKKITNVIFSNFKIQVKKTTWKVRNETNWLLERLLMSWVFKWALHDRNLTSSIHQKPFRKTKGNFLKRILLLKIFRKKDFKWNAKPSLKNLRFASFGRALDGHNPTSRF